MIDANYLCHRAYHSVQDMVYGDVGVGVLYGVLRDILYLQDFFKTSRVVFAFDPGGSGLRSNLSAVYKSSRYKRYEGETEEEQESRAALRQQIKALHEKHLPGLGYKNVFSAVGFEGDDIIAKIIKGMPRHEEAIIVSSDQDFWQCLQPNVTCYNPHQKKCYSYNQFVGEWGILPKQWASVKAFAGCKSDDVIGIPGVGEKTAAKWLRNELGAHTKAAKAIKSSRSIYKRNLPLVRLPFKGCPLFEIVPDEVTEEKWHALIDSFEMNSLRATVPYGIKTKSKGRKRAKKRKGFGFNS